MLLFFVVFLLLFFVVFLLVELFAFVFLVGLLCFVCFVVVVVVYKLLFVLFCFVVIVVVVVYKLEKHFHTSSHWFAKIPPRQYSESRNGRISGSKKKYSDTALHE